MELITDAVTLQNLHGNVLADGEWAAGARRNLGLERVDDSTSVIHHLRSENDYLVHRGTLADFASLQSDVPGRGAAQLLTIELVLGASGEASPQVDVAVIEYDSHGTKSRVSFYDPGELRTHALSSECRHFLIALRFRGQGEVSVRHFRVDAHDVPVLPDGREWMTQTAVAPLAGYVRRLLRDAAGDIPTSNGSRHHAPRPYSVALMAERSMVEFYRGAFERVDHVTPENYRQVLADHEHGVLLYVETGSGPEGWPWRAGGPDGGPIEPLDEILGHIRRRGGLTAFQSTVDADGVTERLWIAERFDHVFTSHEDNLQRFRTALGQDRVHHLPSGANPLLHHPLGAFREPLGAAFLEGHYPGEDDPARTDLDVLLDSLVHSDVDLLISDGNFGDPELSFPPRLRSRSTASFGPAVARRLPKLFRHHVAVNSSALSRTLWAGRIHELQAQGLSVLSNFARAVFNSFPNVRFVPVTADLSDLRGPLSLGQLAARLDGVRAVLSRHTVFDLADVLLGAMGLEPGADRDRVLVLTDDVPGARAMFDRQTYPNRVLRARDEFPTAEALDEFCAQERIAYLAPWSASTGYEVDYLQDRVNVFKFVDRDYATQLVHASDWDLTSDPVHEYTDHCGRRDHTLFSLKNRPASAWWTVEDGAEIPGGYATDPLQVDFPVGRRFAPAGRDSTLVTADRPAPAAARLTVIMPVFNNGRFLLGTSLPSLRRQAMWPDLSVSLVDDGSTDAETLRICESLAAECPNISLYRFDDGGSGSASRPRNKGVERAGTELVTFLDPDNEISPGGYDRLVQIHDERRRAGQAVQFVGGYQVKVAGDARPMGRHAHGSRVVEDVRTEFFGVRRFPLISTQAAVVQRSLFDGGELRFVERAAGEDTLFGWEVILAAQRVCFTDAAHIIYYAGRDGSVTNDLGADFFRKYLILERVRIERLAHHGILDNYRAKHFDHYMEQWYLPRLEQVRADERDECRAILDEITELYRRSSEPQSPPDRAPSLG